MDVEVARPVARTAAVPPRDDGLSSRGEGQGATDDSETRCYRNTLDGRRRLPPLRHCGLTARRCGGGVVGHALAAMSQAPAKAERCKALPQAVATTNVVHLMNTTMRGVTHSPLDPPGRACEDAQKWGHHVSLSSPSIPQYRAEYYRIHHPADIPEEDRLHPHTLWSTSASASVLKRDWEGIT